MNTLASCREAEEFFKQLPPYHLSKEETRLLAALRECSEAADALGLPQTVSLQQWAMRRAADESEVCLKNVLARLSLPALPPFPPKKMKLPEGPKGLVASSPPGQDPIMKGSIAEVMNDDIHSHDPDPLPPLTPPPSPSPPPESTWDCPECGNSNTAKRNKCIGCGLKQNSAAKRKHHEMNEIARIPRMQRPAPQGERELQRQEHIAAFFASLPQDDFTADEMALREGLLALLQLKLETNQRYPPAVYECSGSKGCPKITKLKMRVIPPGVPLSDWIDSRIGDEARTSWDDQRHCTVVRLVHESDPLDVVYDADSMAGKAWKEEDDEDSAAERSVAERSENNTRKNAHKWRNRGGRRRFPT